MDEAEGVRGGADLKKIKVRHKVVAVLGILMKREGTIAEENC